MYHEHSKPTIYHSFLSPLIVIGCAWVKILIIGIFSLVILIRIISDKIHLLLQTLNYVVRNYTLDLDILNFLINIKRYINKVIYRKVTTIVNKETF